MLKGVKSAFIIKKIFYHVDYTTKILLVVYNKILHNILNISITDIRRLSGRYIIGERNGKGKEYKSYNEQLIFEGEYLNWKRNGKGKEYDENNILIFEGEYLKGKRNGKGKENNQDNLLIFEGDYLNGERNGKGKEYNDKSVLIFEGEYLKGLKWNGKGREFDAENNELIYEGE